MPVTPSPDMHRAELLLIERMLGHSTPVVVVRDRLPRRLLRKLRIQQRSKVN